MITPQYVQLMARYNQWMNDKVYASASRMSDEDRRADRHSHFKSVHSTLNYLLWADYIWIGRFAQGTALEKEYPKGPMGVDLYADWEALKAARVAMDHDILAWAGAVEESWLAGDYSWFSILTKTTLTKPAWQLVSHLFNHQTDHRGQVTTLLVQQGLSPGDSDLMLMPAP